MNLPNATRTLCYKDWNDEDYIDDVIMYLYINPDEPVLLLEVSSIKNLTDNNRLAQIEKKLKLTGFVHHKHFQSGTYFQLKKEDGENMDELYIGLAHIQTYLNNSSSSPSADYFTFHRHCKSLSGQNRM